MAILNEVLPLDHETDNGFEATIAPLTKRRVTIEEHDDHNGIQEISVPMDSWEELTDRPHAQINEQSIAEMFDSIECIQCTFTHRNEAHLHKEKRSTCKNKHPCGSNTHFDN